MEVWTNLKEKVIRHSENYQIHLNQIFSSLISSNLIAFNKNFTAEEVIEEAKETRNEINQLKQKNQSQLDKIFDILEDSDTIEFPYKNHTFEQVITETNRVISEVKKLEKENWKLRRKLDGYGSDDDGPKIEEED